MKISEVIAHLETQKRLRGDIAVTIGIVGKTNLYEVGCVAFQDTQTFRRQERQSLSEFSVNLSFR